MASLQKEQRYKCRETACDRRTFILDYHLDNLRVKQQIVNMALNGSGVQIQQVLHVSPSTVIRELKKRTQTPTNLAALKHLNPEQVEVDICLVQLPQESDGPESR